MKHKLTGIKRAASLGILTITTLAVAAPAAQAGPFHGVVTQTNLGAPDYALMDGANVGTLRYSVRWATIRPSASGPFNWSSLDPVVASAAAEGVRVLPILDAPSPPGVSDPPTSKSARKGFASFARAVADRYGRGGSFWPGRADVVPITAYQVYNEQNGPAYWGGRPKPRSYGKLLRATSKAIRSQDRRAEIVLGGMFSSPSGRGAITSWAFLNRLYGMRGIKRSFKTVAVHPYSRSLRGVKRVIAKMRRVTRQNRDRPKMRITEFGWGSESGGGAFNVGLNGQAKMLRKAFRLFENNRREWKLKGVNWFALRDNPAAACHFCPSSGLVRADRSPKPSYWAFKAAANR